MGFLYELSAILIAAPQILAQSLPFLIDGPLGGVSATSATQYNSGGSINIAGTTVVVPENLLVAFPAAFIPFRDFAANAAQFAGYEVSVEGNYAGPGGQAVAGTVSISQFNLGGGQGEIDSVDTAGTIKIKNGPTLRINTPNGVYAAAYDRNPFFTCDEANPSISSFSGYPMCIPRSANDPDCPSDNRALNGDRVYTPKNTSAMAPFLPGDFVTWDGVTNGGEILVHSLTAENVQQKTSADAGDPVYIRVEDVLIGINDGKPNNEFPGNRFTGYVSDPTVQIAVYRIDIDPCTGDETEVQVAAAALKAGDVRYKFDNRPDSTANARAAREYRFKATKGAKTVAKGIQAGQYVSPISEVLWPENNVPGSPFTQHAFEQFGHLKDGFVFDGKQWGPLRPWPGAPTPTPAKTCTGNELDNAPPPPPPPSTDPTSPPAAAESPVASAGQALTGQLAGSLITIIGSNTNTKLTDAQLTFAWTGPDGITINNANKATMNFVNPWLAAPTTSKKSTFTLKICLASDGTTCSSASVDVTTDKTKDTVTITSFQYTNRQSGTVTVYAKSNNVLTGVNGANLEIQLSGTGNFVRMTQQPAVNAGEYVYILPRATRQPSSVAVRSNKGSDVVRVTTPF